ncbi:MAG: hypothetical protein M9949_04950 [Candidatus Kapabacteria bacterium]|nr:hypothetical protein [Candidatus Kapabacteria bacterium]
MKEMKEYLTEMIAEYEVRCKEYKEQKDDMGKGDNFNTEHFSYVDGKIDEAQFTLKKLKDKLKSINQTGESA